MRLIKIPIITICFIFSFLIPSVQSEVGAEITLSNIGVHVSAISGTTYLHLRVLDPNGSIACDLTTEGSDIIWNVTSNNPDGNYTYEIRQSSVEKQIDRNSSTTKTTGASPYIKSGGFLLMNGEIIVQEETEASTESIADSFLITWLGSIADFLVPSAAAADVHLTDVVIQGSECVGIDCATTESFGFDTIRLKENNLRIHFDDTSNSASFPGNDWRIIINDTTNGGKSLFAIEDSTAARRPFTLEAGAPANALYVEDGGNVGLGTATPVTNLHVVDGNTPTLRLEQDGSAGFTAQTWDLAGNEANFFVRDVTNGSTLPFRIKPGSKNATLFIQPEGRVAINTDQTPAHNLHVEGDALITGNLELGSSRTIKNNIYNLDAATAHDAFNKLQPVRFHYNNAPEEESLGFIAEDVPALVATKNRNSLSTMDIVAVLTKVVQEQQETISKLENSIERINTDMKSNQ